MNRDPRPHTWERPLRIIWRPIEWRAGPWPIFATSDRRRAMHRWSFGSLKSTVPEISACIVAPPKLFGGVFLPDSCLHECRPGEEKPAALGHKHVVGHDRQVGPAGNAHAHDRGDLRDAHRGHDSVVPEDTPEVILVGEDVLLQRQEHAGRVDEVERRDAVLHRNGLRAENLLRRHREKRPGFHRRVIGDDHAEASGDSAKAGDGAGGGRSAPLFVHLEGGEEGQFEELGPGIEKKRNALPGGQPLLGVLRLDGLRASTFADGASCCLKTSSSVAHFGRIGAALPGKPGQGWKQARWRTAAFSRGRDNGLVWV